MKRRLFLLVLTAMSSRLLLASDQINQEEAFNRMQQAVAKPNIFELPSFVMKATAQVDNHGKTMEGSCRLWWNGPDQWREEIAFPGYREVQVGAKGTLWVQRSTDFVPLPIYHLRQALEFGSNAASTATGSLIRIDLSKEATKKQRQKKEHGNKLTCFEVEDEDKHSSEVCVNDSTGTIANDSSFHAADDFQPIGGKIFPRVLSSHENGKTLAKVNITEFTSPVRFALNVFTPPDGVQPNEGCMNPSLSHLAQKNQSRIPRRCAQATHSGYGEVGRPDWRGRDPSNPQDR